MKQSELADLAQECVVVQQLFQVTLDPMLRKQSVFHQVVGFVDTQVRAVVTVLCVTEVVQKRLVYAGKAIAEAMAVCVQKAVGVVQVGVQLVQLVGAVLRQTTGAQLSITDTAVLFVTDVLTAGTA